MNSYTTKSNAHIATAQIKQYRTNFTPKIGIVLGSGLSSLAFELEDAISISYEQLTGFPSITVHGHHANLILGYLAGVPVVCLQGRTHSYEGSDMSVVKTYVRTLKLLGCEYFLATNASGSLRTDVGPGELMMITDHINLQPHNPLIGKNDDEFGPRFFALDQGYDKIMQEKLLLVAKNENINLHQGVYISVTGPNYETAAEIKAFKTLGADAVGMSTVPEVLVANHCGLKVAVIATITNYATGIATTSHSHDEVVRTASQASDKLNLLVKNFVKTI